jgi:hypothetical protein
VGKFDVEEKELQLAVETFISDLLIENFDVKFKKFCFWKSLRNLPPVNAKKILKFHLDA